MKRLGMCARQRNCLVTDLEAKQEQRIGAGTALSDGSSVEC